MSEFRGLHNPERHRLLSDGSAICDDSDDDVEQYWGCIEDCSETDPCKCCLAAEVEVLRAALSGLGQRVFDAENTLANVRECVDALRQWPLWANRDDYINALVRALDGGNT